MSYYPSNNNINIIIILLLNNDNINPGSPLFSSIKMKIYPNIPVILSGAAGNPGSGATKFWYLVQTNLKLEKIASCLISIDGCLV